MESLFLTFETTTFLFGVIVQWHFKLVFTFDQGFADVIFFSSSEIYF